MQNKYKMPSYERTQAIAIVRAYKEYSRYIAEEEHRILSLSGGRYETIGDERAYQPTGKGATGAPTEDKALRLEKLHRTYKARCVKAVDESLKSINIYGEPNFVKKVKQALFMSCIKGKCFNFDYAGIDGISRATFYRFRNEFLQKIISNLEKNYKT